MDYFFWITSNYSNFPLFLDCCPVHACIGYSGVGRRPQWLRSSTPGCGVVIAIEKFDVDTDTVKYCTYLGMVARHDL